ncbi:hypothetical protein MSG28_006935 [Choristoneura fumiferana]|uniref:Uncharacterized protein n=1 Tax=Choristoneura fumiferana TaxID=7141 RepID=A0ACC0JLN2_CHOFU|nr:hypothetical protein MSG28_006935 [Choristoneura fumiferana]
MKGEGVIILSVLFMLTGITAAINGSYCCSETTDDVLEDEEGRHICFNEEQNSTMTFSLRCSDNMTVILANDTDFMVRLNPDATLGIMLDEVIEWSRIPPGNFCIGLQTQNDSSRITVIAVCQDEEEQKFVSEEVLGYCMATSSVFLALTAFVYISLPELRDVQGKSIISLCSSLAIANAMSCVLKVMEYSDMTWCAVRGGHQSATAGGSSFGILYTRGVPILLTVILIIVNYHPGHHEKPGIGHNHCWFLDLKRMWMYMYSVISILMAANAAIFVYTSVFLWKYTFSSSHVRALRYKVITDLTNCLQGVIIFLTLVVFRRRVVKALHKRNALCCLNGVAERYLAVGTDDEDDIVTHTIAVPLEEK